MLCTQNRTNIRDCLNSVANRSDHQIIRSFASAKDLNLRCIYHSHCLTCILCFFNRPKDVFACKCETPSCRHPFIRRPQMSTECLHPVATCHDRWPISMHRCVSVVCHPVSRSQPWHDAGRCASQKRKRFYTSRVY
jgi:hypothetical protein